MPDAPPASLRLALAKLDLPPEASIEDARAAYRELLQVWHPDKYAKNPVLQARATQKTKELIAAWELVKSSHDSSARGQQRGNGRAERRGEQGAEQQQRAEREQQQAEQRRAEQQRAEQQRAEQQRAEQQRAERQRADSRARREAEEGEEQRGREFRRQREVAAEAQRTLRYVRAGDAFLLGLVTYKSYVYGDLISGNIPFAIFYILVTSLLVGSVSGRLSTYARDQIAVYLSGASFRDRSSSLRSAADLIAGLARNGHVATAASIACFIPLMAFSILGFFGISLLAQTVQDPMWIVAILFGLITLNGKLILDVLIVSTFLAAHRLGWRGGGFLLIFASLIGLAVWGVFTRPLSGASIASSPSESNAARETAAVGEGARPSHPATIAGLAWGQLVPSDLTDPLPEYNGMVAYYGAGRELRVAGVQIDGVLFMFRDQRFVGTVGHVRQADIGIAVAAFEGHYGQPDDAFFSDEETPDGLLSKYKFTTLNRHWRRDGIIIMLEESSGLPPAVSLMFYAPGR